MLADDARRARADGARRQNVLVLLDGEDLAADQAGHADPVEKAEHDKQRDHVGAQPGQDRSVLELQHLVEHHRQKDDDQHIRQGVDDIHDPHHDQVHSAAQISGDTAVEHADDQNDDTGKQAHRQGDPGAVDHADEVVAALFIGAEDMGEAGSALFDVLLLHLAVGEGSQVLGALVPPAVHGKDLLIAVGNDQGRDDNGDHNGQQHNQAGHRQWVPEELAHAVLEKGGALAHYVLLAFLVLRGGDKLLGGELAQVDLHAEGILLRQIVCHFLFQSFCLLSHI